MNTSNISYEKPTTEGIINEGKGPEKISIFLGGFPYQTSASDAEEYILSLSDSIAYTIITRCKNLFRGFAFIHFDKYEDAENFIKKEYYYKDKLLDCSISKDHNSYIRDCLNNLKRPKKIFIHGIPKQYKKCELQKYFEPMGEFCSLILIQKENQSTNNAFVTFGRHEEAMKCAKMKTLKLKCGKNIVMGYSRPKFSGFMMHKIDTKIKQVIKDITNGQIEYRPEDFEDIDKHFNLKFTKETENFNIDQTLEVPSQDKETMYFHQKSNSETYSDEYIRKDQISDDCDEKVPSFIEKPTKKIGKKSKRVKLNGDFKDKNTEFDLFKSYGNTNRTGFINNTIQKKKSLTFGSNDPGEYKDITKDNLLYNSYIYEGDKQFRYSPGALDPHNEGIKQEIDPNYQNQTQKIYPKYENQSQNFYPVYENQIHNEFDPDYDNRTQSHSYDVNTYCGYDKQDYDRSYYNEFGQQGPCQSYSYEQNYDTASYQNLQQNDLNANNIYTNQLSRHQAPFMMPCQSYSYEQNYDNASYQNLQQNNLGTNNTYTNQPYSYEGNSITNYAQNTIPNHTGYQNSYLANNENNNSENNLQDLDYQNYYRAPDPNIQNTQEISPNMQMTQEISPNMQMTQEISPSSIINNPSNKYNIYIMQENRVTENLEGYHKKSDAAHDIKPF